MAMALVEDQHHRLFVKLKVTMGVSKAN
jgi:hypothetical protein